MYTMHLSCYEVKQPNLKLTNQHKLLLGSDLLDIALFSSSHSFKTFFVLLLLCQEKLACLSTASTFLQI
jgi:hypothetical protein